MTRERGHSIHANQSPRWNGTVAGIVTPSGMTSWPSVSM